MQIKLVTSVKLMDKLFAEISNNRRGLEAQMHTAACSVLAHVGKHKDVRLVSKLLLALEDEDKSTAILTNSLRAWFEAHGPVMFDGAKIKYDQSKALMLAKAMATPFWKFAPQKAYQAVDVLGMLASMTKKLLKDQQELGTDHAQMIAQIEALSSSERKRREAQPVAGVDEVALKIASGKRVDPLLEA